MVFVTRKAHFNAAHRLHNPDKTDRWNKEKFGKCNHENWHGHNYTVSVTVVGIPDEETGCVIDFSDLKAIIHKRIIVKCDHKNLNLDVPFLKGIMPSTENLAKVFFYELEDSIKERSNGDAFLYEVALQETERNSAKYCPYLLNRKLPIIEKIVEQQQA